MNILLVDDQDDQAFLVREAFAATQVDVMLHHVLNGQQCIDYLSDPALELAALPDLVLLDLDMPGLDGFETLELRSKSDALKKIPFVVLSTSNAAPDVARAYLLGCNSYVAKPFDFDELAQMLTQLVAYWSQVSMTPVSHLRR